MDKNKIIALLIMITVFVIIPLTASIIHRVYYPSQFAFDVLVYLITIASELGIYIVSCYFKWLYEDICEQLK